MEALLLHGAILDGEFRWREAGKHRYKAEAWLGETYEGARVKLVGSFNSQVNNLSYTLVWANCRIRSLDVGGPPHTNPDQVVVPTPHKHRWTDSYRDRVAYAPTDITSRDLRGVLLEFLQECNVVWTGVYYPPVIQESLL